MTNTYMPQEFIELAESVADLSPREADVFEAGALAIIGIFKQSAMEVADKVRSDAIVNDLPEADARQAFDYFFEPLTDLMDDRARVLQQAVRTAQNVLPPTPESLIEGLLTALLGEQAAGEALADLSAEERIVEDEPEAEDPLDEEDEDETVVVTEKDFEEFFTLLFGVKPTV